MYKVVTKIIANRIKPFLPNLIGPQQTSFIKGRRACDNAILVQEILNYANCTKLHKGCLILKLDLEKAFDRLEWSFVYHALCYFNFPPKLLLLS